MDAKSFNIELFRAFQQGTLNAEPLNLSGNQEIYVRQIKITSPRTGKIRQKA